MSDREQKVATILRELVAEAMTTGRVSCDAFAHRIAALSASPVDLDAVKREAAREALTRFAMASDNFNANTKFSDRNPLAFRDREYPAPAPDRVELSDGSVVEAPRNGGDLWFARFPNGLSCYEVLWRSLLNDQHTGADFDALKAFAARVGGQP